MRIDFERVVVDLPGHRALDEVTGTLASGAVTAVIGPSGAGKSTLLGVVAGLVAPDAGVVRFDGEDVTALAPEARRLGVVFQDLRLFPFLSGRDNVGFGPRVAGLADGDRRARVDEALRQVHATSFADRPARVLSGGERQRIAIARALATRPRALLLDEPFASLDAELRRSIRDDLRQLVRELGMTAALVTHDRDDAFALASRIVVVRAGRIEQSGEADQLYERPASEYVATLLGEANLVAVERHDATSVRLGGRLLPATGTGTRALLRPEALVIDAGGEGWAARVVETRFAGAAWRTVLDAGPLGTLIAQGARRPDGDQVILRVPERLHTV